MRPAVIRLRPPVARVLRRLVILLLLAGTALARISRRPGSATKPRFRNRCRWPCPPPADVQQSIERGVQFLLADQNPDGSWGTPGTHQGPEHLRTGSGCSSRVSHGRDVAVHQRADRGRLGQSGVCRPAIDRGEQWLLENLPILAPSRMRSRSTTCGDTAMPFTRWCACTVGTRVNRRSSSRSSSC